MTVKGQAGVADRGRGFGSGELPAGPLPPPSSQSCGATITSAREAMAVSR